MFKVCNQSKKIIEDQMEDIKSKKKFDICLVTRILKKGESEVL